MKKEKDILKRLVRAVLGLLTVCMLSGCGSEYYEDEEDDEVPLYEMSLEEKLKTRGAINIHFKNTEYIDELDKYKNAYIDRVVFYDNKGYGYASVLSYEGNYTLTFEPGDYNAYSTYLDEEWKFTITEPGEQTDLVIDYKDKSHKFTKQEETNG